jgi:hypothetical protein
VEWRALGGLGFGLRFLSGHGAPGVGWSVITRLARDGGVLRCGVVDLVYQRRNKKEGRAGASGNVEASFVPAGVRYRL